MPEDVMRYPFNWALLKHSPGGGNQVKMRSCGLTTKVDVVPMPVANSSRTAGSVIRDKTSCNCPAGS
jgi:hypothetical protein